MENKKKLRVAVLGCGWFGNFHLDNLLKMEGVEIAALYNRGAERLNKTGERVPAAHLYGNLETLFENEKPDAAVLCLTPDCHGEAERLCCENGVAMYIEKPIDVDAEQAALTAKRIEAAGVITAVGYQERYSPALDRIRAVLEKEPVGLVTASWIGGMPGPLWWRTKAQSGGQVVEQTTHMADMLRYLFGEAEQVYAVGRRDARFGGAEHDVEDFSAATVSFKSGVVASLTSACYTENGHVGIEIYTPQTRIEYLWGESVRITAGGKTETITLPPEHHFKAMEAFLEAVRSGDGTHIRSPYSDAVKSLALTLAVNRSMETGRVEPVR